MRFLTYLGGFLKISFESLGILLFGLSAMGQLEDYCEFFDVCHEDDAAASVGSPRPDGSGGTKI